MAARETQGEAKETENGGEREREGGRAARHRKHKGKREEGQEGLAGLVSVDREVGAFPSCRSG